MPRLFIGLEVPEAIASRLAMLRGGLSGARWADPSDYHLTIRFIGDINRRLANEIDEEMVDLYGDSIRVRITGLGVFGGDKPHTLYAGIEPNKQLVSLQGDSERRLRKLGLKPEQRKFVPHITLARLRGASTLDLADYLQSFGHLNNVEFVAEHFALFSARDMIGGGPYIVEAAYPLH
ncbi:MAG: RNA 2',3'-cyclic phosphodiesterase [Rhabdaerophilum sp.]